MEYDTAIDAGHQAGATMADRLSETLQQMLASVLKAGYEYAFLEEFREVRDYSEQGWRLRDIVQAYTTAQGRTVGPIFIMECYRDE